MGDSKATYQYKVSLLSETAIQIRHNALEAARVSANKVMFDKLGETGYLVKLVAYPHVILRENRMIATAGADRLKKECAGLLVSQPQGAGEVEAE